MDFKKIKNKLIRNFTDYGFWVCLGKTFFYITGGFYKRVNTIVYKIDLADNITDLNDDHFEFRLISEKDHAYIKAIEEMAEWLEGRIELDLAAGKKYAYLLSIKGN